MTLPAPSQTFGATPDEWLHLELVVGAAHLLPVVSRPGAVISPRSSLKALGKTPSVYNERRQVTGIKKWTRPDQPVTSGDVENWSKERDYGICIRTEEVRGLDIDVPDLRHADNIHAAFVEALWAGADTPAMPVRMRRGTGKRLLPFVVAGTGVDLTRRSFKVEGGLVELLASGQQFIAIGEHFKGDGTPSGTRYEWEGGLPLTFPVVTKAQFERAWEVVVETFAVGAPSAARQGTDRTRSDLKGVHDPVANYLAEHGLVLGSQGEKVFVSCPWKSGHTSDSGVTETCWLVAGARGFQRGHFKCLHASCQDRSDTEFLDEIGFRAAAFSTLTEDIGPGLDARPSQRFQPRSVSEILAAKRPGWLVKGLLPKAGLAVVYGESGSGKTFWVLDLVLQVALGRAWRGKQVVQGRVVYVPAEGQGGFRNRVEAFLTQNGLAPSDLDSFAVVTDTPDLLTFDDSSMAEQIQAWGGADIVVIDTLAQATPGANENSSEDLGKAMSACRRLHEATGALVVLVHHAGKDPRKGARGWSGLKAGADVELEIAGSGHGRYARVSKQKDGEAGVCFGFELLQVEIGVDGDGDPITSMVVGQAETTASDARRLSKWQAAVVGAVERLAGLGGAPVSVADAISHAVDIEVYDPGPDGATPRRDRRRDKARIGLESAIEAGLVHEASGFLTMPLSHRAP